MNRIVNEANRVKKDVHTKTTIVCHDVANVCTRTVMLDKAYRYQRVVDCLISWIVWHIGQTGRVMGDKQMACKQKAKKYRTKATTLYKQASTI